MERDQVGVRERPHDVEGAGVEVGGPDVDGGLGGTAQRGDGQRRERSGYRLQVSLPNG